MLEVLYVGANKDCIGITRLDLKSLNPILNIKNYIYMYYNYLHIIKGEQYNVAFSYKDFNLFIINDDQKENINKSLEQRDNFKNDISKILNTSTANHNKIKTIKRITLCVSNDCNLRCKYCYAQGGNYGKERQLMNKETAISFVNFCYKEFTDINEILFFGGEPMLNWKIINLICSLFRDKRIEGGNLNPKFSIITNGTCISESIIKLINEYISKITISIDGSKEINDSNRVFKSGKGTYDKISYFIKKVRSSTKALITFEATYTNLHINSKIARYDVKKMLSEEFKIKGIVVDEDSIDKNNIYQNLDNLTKTNIKESKFECLPIDFWQILFSITNKKDNKFCPIMQDRITVSTKGDLYACQMVNGKDNCKLGNIKDDAIMDKIWNISKIDKDNDDCNNCWCNRLCGGCTVQKFFDKESQCFRYSPNNTVCNFQRKYIEKILQIICAIRIDGELWRDLINVLKIRNSNIETI